MSNFDLKKYLAEGKLLKEDDRVNKVAWMVKHILERVLGGSRNVDVDLERYIDDEYHWQRYEEDEWEDEDLSDDDWDLIKQMMHWAIDKHGPRVLYISLVDDLNYDMVDDWDLELDQYRNYKDAIDADDIFKGFTAK